MDEASYWPALEFRVCREMAGVEACRRLRMWCDGFVAEAFDVDASPQRLRGTTWIGCGGGQQAWSFELLLPVRVSSRDDIEWAGLLPAENVTQWLTVDHDARRLVVAPGEAVEDAG